MKNMSTLKLLEKTEPTTPSSGYVEVYIDEADGHIKQKDDTGTVVDLITKEKT